MDAIYRFDGATSNAEPRTLRIDGLPGGVRAELQCHGHSSHPPGVPTLPLGIRRIPVPADGIAETWSLPIDHTVRAVAVGHRSTPVHTRVGPGDARDLTFSLSPIPADLVEPRTVVRGRLVDPLGRPMPGVPVVARCETRRGPPALSDGNGQYSLEVPAREHVLFDACVLSDEHYVATPGHRVDASGRSWLRRPADPDKPLRLDLARAGAVRGVLRGADGQPLGAARVELRGRGAMIVSATDALGRLAVAGIAPGDYSLTVKGSDGARGKGSVSVVEGAESKPAPLEYRPTGEVFGRVTRPNGEPAAGVVLLLAREIAQRPPGLRRAQPGPTRLLLTDRDGRFRQPHLAEGDWNLRTTGEVQPMKRDPRTTRFPFEIRKGQRTEVTVSIDG